MALLEYTQEDHAETIRGQVWTGPDLKQEGEFQIAVTREALPLYSGAGWAWSMKVEIGEKRPRGPRLKLTIPMRT